jgi:hypothetical protein
MMHMGSGSGIVCIKYQISAVIECLMCFSTASKVSGAPFAEYIYTGSLGRFLGFLACVIQAAFTLGGIYCWPQLFDCPVIDLLC